MNKSAAEILLNKYNLGEATEKEVAILESWYLEEGFETPMFEGTLEYESKRLRILSKIPLHRPRIKKTIKFWPRIAGIAAAVTAIILTVWLYTSQHPETCRGGAISQLADDIAPGKPGATLTLANGKKIKLGDITNGAIAKEAGVAISKSASGQLVYEIKSGYSGHNEINTLSTTKGETYQVRLPDGSLVWLNAASSLTYPVALNHRGVRRVKLEGEAYFEVAKDKAHPFIVESRDQLVEVLGTHFNINGYPDDDNTKTTLLEGSVNVSSLQGGAMQSKVLKPGQQAIKNGRSISVTEIDPDDVTGWKDGKFVFSNEDIKTVMRKISRWYNVEIVYADNLPEVKVTGGISRFQHVSKILEMLETTGGVHFKIEGKKIIVRK